MHRNTIRTLIFMLSCLLLVTGCAERVSEPDDSSQPASEPATTEAANPTPTPILIPRPANEPPTPSPEVAERVDTRFGVPCTFRIDFDLEPYPPIEDLVWSSEHIAVGEVIEVLGPDWAEPDNVNRFSTTRGCLEIMTDYMIEVETRFHGDDVQTMRIRGPGGELDGYEQVGGLAPELDVGDRYLLFLFEAPESETLPDAWAFDLQRARQVLSGDEVPVGLNRTMHLEEVEMIIRDALTGDRPPEEGRWRSLWGWAEEDDD